MGKQKVHELASKLNITSKEVLEVCKTLNISVKSHLSSLEEKDVLKVQKQIEQKGIDKGKGKSLNKKEIEKDKKIKEVEEPVIIRTAVIRDDKQEIVKNNVNQEVGKIQKNTQKDYNIVYREKNDKPLTFDELFGKKVLDKKSKEKTEKKSSNIDSNAKKVDKVEEVVQENHVVKSKTSNLENNQEKNKKVADKEKNKKSFKSFDKENNGKTFNNGRAEENKKSKIDTSEMTEIEQKENKDAQRKMSKQKDKEKENNKYEAQAKKNKKSNKYSNNNYKEDLNKFKGRSDISDMVRSGDIFDMLDETDRRKYKKNKKDKNKKVKVEQAKLTEITIPEPITVKDLAHELKITAAELLKTMMNFGTIVTLNTDLDFDTAFMLAAEFGINAKKKKVVSLEEQLLDDSTDKDIELEERPPVVVVMGHVDHGKTSLLDAIRNTNKIQTEAGGITQHIGAYQVTVSGKDITFLDTPGHEAFTSMRARGAKATDLAVLVVAANDGIMPQTVEAINHAKAAEIPIIVAINKMDLPGANPDKIKQEMMEYELVAEEWGGETIFVPISAKNGDGIDRLLEMIQLQAEMLELKANPNKQAKGTVLEARLDAQKGPIVSMLVNRGTLNIGDTIIVGSSIGRIRNMINYKGERIVKAGPSVPVEVMGLNLVPQAGETFYEVSDEKTAKKLVERRKREQREEKIGRSRAVTLEELYSNISEGNLKKLNIIVKADVIGSAEAIKKSFENLSTEEIAVKVIHSSVGGVTTTDVSLAKVANALIIAFNVRPDNIAKQEAEEEGIEIKQYSIIYSAIEDVQAAMIGMLEPEYEEQVIGNAEIRETFKISKIGTIAGAYVLSGKVNKNAGVRIIRDNVVLCDSKLVSLKRFKDDVKEVQHGYECGIQIENFNDIKVGDTLEVYEIIEIKRKSLKK
ncbi:MAG: translation initiation factor IF-2 [Clostridium sp.]